MDNKLIVSDWYQNFITELRELITEHEFTARWVIVECYHQIGSRIIEVQKEKGISISDLVQHVAVDLQKSERTIWYAVAFAEKYPLLSSAPLEKNISWRGVIHLLEEGKPKKECPHSETGYFQICRQCGKNLGERKF
jgi:hypothetical protein